MPPRKNVKSLYNLSLLNLTTEIKSFIERKLVKTNFFIDSEASFESFLLRCMETKIFLEENLVGHLRWAILDHFLMNSSHQTMVRIDSNKKTVTFGHFPETCFHILALILRRHENVEVLSLRNVWLTGPSLNIFVSSLETMKHLRQLIVPYIATDPLLAALGSWCHFLEHLDISGAESVSDKGVTSLYQQKLGWDFCQTELTSTLRSFLIGGPGGVRLNTDTVANILVRFPKLLTLGSYPHTKEAVLKALKKRGGLREGASFKLRYIHDVSTERNQFEDLLQCCPGVKAIFLDSPSLSSLELLPKFSLLRRLKFNKVTFPIIEDLVKIMGSQLTDIELVTSKGTLDLSVLGDCCRNLQSFEVYYSQNIIVKGQTTFPRLRKCVIYSTEISGPAANTIIEASPMLEHLNLSSAKTLTTRILDDTVAGGGLAHCQELAIMSAPLCDFHSVELLLDKLPRLKLLGRLDGWNVRESQLAALKRKVANENYDILLWYNLPLHLELEFDEELLDL